MEKRPYSRLSEKESRRLVYLAAERTLLSWVRAALSLMILGFVVDRFGLFLRQMSPKLPSDMHIGSFSFWAGTALVVLGVLVTGLAAIKYLRFYLGYRHEGKTETGQSLLFAIFLASMIAVAGAAIAVFLVTVTGA